MIKNMVRWFVGGIAFSSFAMANTHNVDLGFQDELLLLDVGTQFERQDVKLSLQYYDKDDKGHLASASLLKTHDMNIHHVELGVRPLKLWSENSDESGHAISIGGLYSLNLTHDVAFSFSGFYAPKVLSYSKLEGFSQVDTRINYEAIPDFFVYTGYSWIQFDYENDNNQSYEQKYAENIFVGVSFKF